MGSASFCFAFYAKPFSINNIFCKAKKHPRFVFMLAKTHILSVPLLGGAFVVLWSSGFIGSKFGLGYAGAFTLLFWRYLAVVAVLGALVLALGKWRRLSAREILRHALVGCLAHAVWLAAVFAAIELQLPAGLAAFITALQPVMTGALSARLTGEAVSRREWLGLGLGLVAVGVVIGDGIALGGSLLAHLLPFLAVAAITLATLVERGATLGGQDQTPVLLVTFWHCAASLVVLLPLAVGFEGLQTQWGGGFAFAVAWMAVAVSLGAYGLMFALLRKLPASRVASLLYLSPPVTMLLAWLAFDEALTLAGLAGLALASLAVYLCSQGRAG